MLDRKRFLATPNNNQENFYLVSEAPDRNARARSGEGGKKEGLCRLVMG